MTPSRCWVVTEPQTTHVLVVGLTVSWPVVFSDISDPSIENVNAIVI